MKQEKAVARLFSGKKAFTLMLAVLLVLGCSVGATLAYLTATTDTVTNTFTVGKVDITLQEHAYDANNNTLNTTAATVTANTYKLIPGKNMPKDPFVTVKAGSEKCWLFVRIDEANVDNDILGYSVKYTVDDTEWKSLYNNYDEGFDIYYRIVDANASDQKLYVLGKDGEICTDTAHNTGCVTVNSSITSSFQSTPVLKFTAAAIQYDGLEVAAGEDLDGSKQETAAKAAFNNLPDAFTTTRNLNTPAPEGGETAE